MSKFDNATDELAQCLALVSTGDCLAFEKIYKLTSPKLNAIILSMVKDEALTYDILQQSYLAIWTHSKSYDPQKGKAFTWMLVITRRKALDMIRKRAHFSTTEQLPEILEDETARSDSAAESLMLRRLIWPHLQALSAQTREAVILSSVYGLTSREIGERVGVSTNTAKSWVRRGLAKLKHELGGETFDALL